MRETRNDLSLTGIDLAPELPAAPEGTTTQGGVAMENLPFEDVSFGAVVSQFGFEYGDVVEVAREIARVLASDGAVGLMVHRGDGPILEHNTARRGAIEWAIKEKAVGTVISSALEASNGGPDIAQQVAAALALLGAHNFGQETPAWEIPEAMRRAVAMGQSEGTASVLAAIEAIEVQARNELGRIASLKRACTTADDRQAIEAAFSAHGLALQSTKAVAEPSGRALADFLTFR
jgi:SAM-dependent methyltransferase